MAAVLSWARLDDVFPEHPKLNEHDGTLVEVGVSVVLTALQTRAICYCSRNLTDGFLPTGALSSILADVPGTDWPTRMVEAGLWHKTTALCEKCDGLVGKAMRLAQVSHTKSGFYVHDFLDYNPSKRRREKVVLQRRGAAKSRWNKKKGAMRDAVQTALQKRCDSYSSRMDPDPLKTKIKTEDLPPYTPPVLTGAPNSASVPMTPTSSPKRDGEPPKASRGKPRPPSRREWCATCARLLDLLNELTGKRYEGSTKALGFIHARHSERGVETCERVIRVKVWKWMGTKWEDYLRPETLFAPTKFDGYANETVPKATGRKFDPYSPADQEERAKLHEKVGVISPERRAAGVNFLEHQIRETEGKLDAATESAVRDTLSKKLEELRLELVFLTAVKGVE